MHSFAAAALSYFHPDRYDLDPQIEAIAEQVNDPFCFSHTSSYHEIPYHWTENQCMDAVVAGISESLGLPQGLSFNEVFARIV